MESMYIKDPFGVTKKHTNVVIVFFFSCLINYTFCFFSTPLFLFFLNSFFFCLPHILMNTRLSKNGKYIFSIIIIDLNFFF